MPRRSLAPLLLLVASTPLAGCAHARRPCPPCLPCARPVVPPTRGAPADRWSAAAQVHGRGARAVWSYLAATYDRDGDGRIPGEEHPRGDVVVDRLDRDGDGALTSADFEGPTRMAHYVTALVMERIAADPPPASPDGGASRPERARRGVPEEETLSRAFDRTDLDGSGTLAAEELATALASAARRPVPGVLDLPAGVAPFPFLLEATDADASGAVTRGELLAWRAAQAGGEDGREAAGRPSGDAPAPAPAPRPAAPAVGAPAPDFTLRSRGGTTTRSLSDLRGTPVVLVFGSYTCPPFRASAGWIREAWDRHGRDVRFLFVYVREAHAIDGRAPMPDADQPLVEEPASFEDRRAVADACALRLRFGVFETLVDDLDDSVARAYVAPPVRLYVVDRDGLVAYRSEPGPFGLRRAEFDAALHAVLAGTP